MASADDSKPPATAPAARRAFRRLPGRAPQSLLGVVRRQSRLWLGEDYLVQVDTVFWREKTRRFAYGDIQALLLRETPRGLIISLVCGGLTAVFGLLTWGMESADWRWLPGGCAVFFGALLIYNAARGGTCRCALQTALGPQTLPSLSRRRPARRAWRQIIERVKAVQGVLPPGAAE